MMVDIGIDLEIGNNCPDNLVVRPLSAIKNAQLLLKHKEQLFDVAMFLAQKINNHRRIPPKTYLSLLPDQPPGFAKDQTSNPNRDTITADCGRWGPNPGAAYGRLCRSPSGTSQKTR